MLPRFPLILLDLLVLAGVCKGFDFTFHEPSSNKSNVQPGEACGVLTCTETITGGADDGRKIQTLAIYRHKSSDVSGLDQWEQLASVTSRAPRARRVSDAKHTTGTLSDTAARIEVKLVKSHDCDSLKFACISRLEDANGGVTTMKSVIGGGDGPSGDSEMESYGTGQHDITSKVETFMAALEEKLKCIESRLGDSSKRDERLEGKLEALGEKINNLERTVSHELHATGDRIEDKMDRVKDRLEDKLSDIRDEKASSAATDVYAKFSSQLAKVGGSVDSLNITLNSLNDGTRQTQDTTQTSRVLNNKLDSVMSTVSSLVAATHNLTTGVGVLSHSCADKSPTPVSEYFDVFQDGRREWRLAFRGTAYNNVFIYPAYLYGTGIPAEVELGCRQFNHSIPCANHYRNTDALDNWANVDEVLLALFVKGQMVKYITFNGRGSTWINWFEATRVIGSSWSDLKTKSHNFFSIEGHSESDLLRRFYVNHIYNHCPGDQGWFAAADAVPGRCPWERKLAHPAFLYAKGNSVTTWDARHTVGTADTMGVFIKYQ